jgi:hypothetical protein
MRLQKKKESPISVAFLSARTGCFATRLAKKSFRKVYVKSFSYKTYLSQSSEAVAKIELF